MSVPACQGRHAGDHDNSSIRFPIESNLASRHRSSNADGCHVAGRADSVGGREIDRRGPPETGRFRGSRSEICANLGKKSGQYLAKRTPERIAIFEPLCQAASITLGDPGGPGSDPGSHHIEQLRPPRQFSVDVVVGRLRELGLANGHFDHM